MKLKWKIGERPTGRYRSFTHRSWPRAEIRGDKEERAVAALYPVKEVSYSAAIAETTLLKISIMDWRGDKPQWRRMTEHQRGVTKAKEAAELFLTRNPSLLPKEK